MDWKFAIKPEFLYGNDWMDFELTWPEAAQWVRLRAIHNELRKLDHILAIEKSERLTARREVLLAKLAEHAVSEHRWDHRFLR